MEPGDLDVLIGDLKKEAARRRAAPDFPIDEEARLSLEMDRQGPSGGTVDLAALLEAIRAVADRDAGPAGGQAGSDPSGSVPPDRRSDLAELAELVGSALRALSARVADLDRRVARLAPPWPLPGAPPWPLPAAPPAAPPETEAAALGHWDQAVTDLAGAVTGAGTGPVAGGQGDGSRRILVAGPGARHWTELLAGQGHDVYGVDPTGPPYSDAGPVRAGGVAAHLQTVGEGALAMALLVGPLAAAELPHLDRWASALAVRAGAVMVVSEAPWAWRLRLGEPRADVSAWRPVGPETWMAALDAAGYQLSGRYGPDGRDYFLAGRVRPGVADPSR